jgi:nitrite transporter NirC
MFNETIQIIGNASIAKSSAAKMSPLRYITASMLAGGFVGLGIILIFSIGAPFGAVSSPAVKILMGVSFGIALSLVIMAGSELFTGQNMIASIGVATNKISLKDLSLLWILSYIGNLAGSLLIAFFAVSGGILKNPAFHKFINDIASVKMNAPAADLFFKAILCNILVCLAVWMSFKLKEEIAKLVMIFWCLFAFISSGYEHSIANMTLLSIPLMGVPFDTVTWAGFVRNIGIVSLGNIVGGLLIGLAYTYISIVPEKIRKDGGEHRVISGNT